MLSHHLPDEIADIDAVPTHFSTCRRSPFFDTAFHRSMPKAAQRFALPCAVWDEDISHFYS
jgi:acetate kinase